MEGGHPGLTLSLALAAGVLLQSLARHVRIPGIVFLLVAGAVLGPDLLGWVDPRSLGQGLFVIVDLAVAVILFEGALNLEISRLRREQAAIRRLVTWGALVTLAGGAASVKLFLGWPWVQAFLFGSLVVVTGPTVVGPLVRQLRLRPKVATVLEAEGVLIDPIGAILAVVMLEFALAPGAESLAAEAGDLVFRLGFGALVGGIAGLALGALLRSDGLVPEGLENVAVLASVLLLFQGCDALVGHSGIVAVTAAGVVVGNMRTHVDRDLREFKDQLSVMLIGLLFVLLAADVRLDDVLALGWSGVAVVASLVLVVRPLCVAVSTLGSALSPSERGLVAWLAPRGIVAAAIASLTATALETAALQQGVAEAAFASGTALRALVFLTIAGTVLLAGFTAAPVATLLRVRLPGRDSVAILGAQGLGLALAQELKEGGAAVVLIDSNPANARRAQELGLTVIYGDALKERTLLRARPESVGLVIGATSNQMLNSIFVSRAREEYGVPRGLVAAPKPGAGLASEITKSEKVGMLFEGPHDVGRWQVRDRQDEILIEYRTYAGRPAEADVVGDEPLEKLPAVGERFVILAIRRGDQRLPMHHAFELKEHDVACIAVHAPEREEADALLDSLGWRERHEPDEPEEQRASA